ncbi:MAG: tRNA preQ1(34) S-adenosylmethionine ribosyltransferase-isomerase QueA [bacterium]
MTTSDFDYNLPEELIAQFPLESRDNSKLLVMNKENGLLEDKKFSDILSFFKEGDCIVLNDTKVLPARIFLKKEETNANIELLLLKNLEKDIWQCLAKPQKRLKIGTILIYENLLKCKVINILPEGLVEVEFYYEGIFNEVLDKIGSMPLPPYIHEKLEDKKRYQTVYAKNDGSAAAPTAGLHFTEELLGKLKEKQVEILYVTLHVGLGTFRPVEVENAFEHKMHTEEYLMTEYTANRLNLAKEEKRKIYAVGTTSVRTLESIMQKYDKFIECSGETDIFIYPGYKFKSIDGLITNFHLPKSTLLMLVSALSSKENIMNAYNYAIKKEYRFFSFGDAMFIK